MSSIIICIGLRMHCSSKWKARSQVRRRPLSAMRMCNQCAGRQRENHRLASTRSTRVGVDLRMVWCGSARWVVACGSSPSVRVSRVWFCRVPSLSKKRSTLGLAHTPWQQHAVASPCSQSLYSNVYMQREVKTELLRDYTLADVKDVRGSYSSGARCISTQSLMVSHQTNV